MQCKVWKRLPNVKRSPVFTRYVVTYIALFLFPFLMLDLFFFARATNQVEQHARDILNHDLDRLKQSISQQFDNMTDVMSSIKTQDIFSSENQMFMPNEWMNQKYACTKIVWKLKELTKGNSLIDTCMLIYRQHNVVFTASTYQNLDTFLSQRLIFDDPDAVLGCLRTAQSSRFFSVCLTDTLTKEHYNALLYVLPFHIEKVASKDAVLVFVISEDELESFAQEILGQQEFRTSLFDMQGTRVLSFGMYANAPQEVNDFITSDVMLRTNQITVGGRTIYMAQSNISTPNLNILLEAPQNDALQSLEDFHKFTLKLCFITLSIGILLTLGASWYNYAPLKKVLRSLNVNTVYVSHSDKQNEYQLLGTAIKNALNENKKLVELINNQSESFFQQVLFELLSDHIQYDNLDRTLDIKNRLPGPEYIVAAVHSEKTECTLADIANWFDLTYVVEQSLSIVNMPQYRCIAVVFCVENMEYAKLFVDGVSEKVRDCRGISIGLSNTYSDIRLLSQCFLEAYLAMDNLLVQGDFGATAYNKDIGSAFKLDPLPSCMMEELCQSIKNGNEAQAVDLFNDMMDEICEDINPLRMRIHLNRIMSNTLETLREVDANRSMIMLDISRCFVHNDSYTVMQSREFREKFISLLRSICNLVHAKQEEMKNSVYKQMINYIDAHFLDFDFSLEKLSHEFGMSTSKLSTAFKQNVGRGFVEYLTQKKMNIAKHMLMTTQASVGEISSYVGYANESYFIRVFRKSNGLTPAQFRKMYSNIAVDDDRLKTEYSVPD